MKYLLLFVFGLTASTGLANSPAASPVETDKKTSVEREPAAVKSRKKPKAKRPTPRDVAQYRNCKSESASNEMLFQALIRNGETRIRPTGMACEIVQMRLLEKANFMARVQMEFNCISIESRSRDNIPKSKMIVADVCDGVKNLQIVDRQDTSSN